MSPTAHFYIRFPLLCSKRHFHTCTISTATTARIVLNTSFEFMHVAHRLVVLKEIRARSTKIKHADLSLIGDRCRNALDFVQHLRSDQAQNPNFGPHSSCTVAAMRIVHPMECWTTGKRVLPDMASDIIQHMRCPSLFFSFFLLLLFVYLDAEGVRSHLLHTHTSSVRHSQSIGSKYSTQGRGRGGGGWEGSNCTNLPTIPRRIRVVEVSSQDCPSLASARFP